MKSTYEMGLEHAAQIVEASDPDKPANWLHRREDLAAVIRSHAYAAKAKKEQAA